MTLGEGVEMSENDSATTTNALSTSITLADMLKIINQIKKLPLTIYSMDFKFIFSDYLPDNTIIVSKDIGKELEKRGLITKPKEQKNEQYQC